VRWLHRARYWGRISVVFGRGLPRQARELTTSGGLDDSLGPEGSRYLLVEDVEGRQANIEDFIFTKDNFVAYSDHARYHS
jgi:hypothetical protein